MFVPLSGRHARGPDDGPLLLLQGCHQRIRTFTALALKLLDSQAAPPEEVAEATGAVLRYFTEALPKHVDDEEHSLRPRLGVLAPPDSLAEMTRQHREIEDVLDALGMLWRKLASDPAALPALALELRPPTLRMAGLWEPHLQLEEREIFPQIAQLGAEVRSTIWAEMRGRRGTRP